MSERSKAYAEAMLAVAKVEGYLTDVEDDLFRFARTVEANDELLLALTNRNLPTERRLAVVEDLMGGKALATSVALASMVVAAGRAGELGEIVDEFVAAAAAERDQEVAEVRSAIPLTDEQITRLTAALSAATGKAVEVKLVVDPHVLGGLVARLGDLVIDGTVRHRLDQLKEQI
jgi:F-type H+-transporting ATPase subunit delta